MPNPSPARAQGTMKLDAMPNPAPARAGGTMKLDAMPNPSPARAQGTMKLQALPQIDTSEPAESLESLDDEPKGKSILPWIIGGVGVAAAALILIVALAMRPSPESGAVVATNIEPAPVNPAPKPKPKPSAPKPKPSASTNPAAVPKPPAPKPQPIEQPAVVTPAPPPFEPPPATAPVTPEPTPVAEKPAPGPPPDQDFPPEPAPVIARAGHPKGPLTLKAILANPKDFADQVIVPADLLMVDSSAGYGMRDLSVRTKDGPYQNLAAGGFRIVLEPEVHNQLRTQLDTRTLVGGWYPAMMGLKVVANPNQPGSFIGRVEWLELLYYIDPRPIAGKLRIYKEAYSVVHLAAPSPSVGWSSNFEQWQLRIQKQTTNIRNMYDREGKPPTYNVMGRQAKNPAGQGLAFHRWVMTHFQ